MPQPKLPPTTRITLWTGLLTALSLVEFGLTLIAMHVAPGFRELNPVAAHALGGGILAAALLKLAALALALVAAGYLAKTEHAKATKALLATWACLFLVVNTLSTLALLGGI